jgi:hypothetical protein
MTKVSLALTLVAVVGLGVALGRLVGLGMRGIVSNGLSHDHAGIVAVTAARTSPKCPPQVLAPAEKRLGGSSGHKQTSGIGSAMSVAPLASNIRIRIPSPPPPQQLGWLRRPSPSPQLAHSALCDGHASPEPKMLVAVLAAPTARSLRSRILLRKTWFQLAPPEAGVVIRFFFARNENGTISDDLAAEADREHDMVFVDTLEAYKNLFRKVNLIFKWVVDWCSGTPYVLKTDDDSFVRVDQLLGLMKELPATRLYYGSFLRGMPARIRNKTTKVLTNNPLPGNTQNAPTWPAYASGAGYLVSHDVASAIAYPPLPLDIQSAEDRGIGVQLFGLNVSYIPSNEKFRPWGHCSPHAVLLHYQRDPGLLRRRYERAIAGTNICGEGWEKNHHCALVNQYDHLEFKCAKGLTIQSITFASIGKHWVGTGYEGACEEGCVAQLRFSLLEWLSTYCSQCAFLCATLCHFWGY